MEQPTLDTGKAVRARPGRRPGRRFGVRGARAEPPPEAQRRGLPEAAPRRCQRHLRGRGLGRRRAGRRRSPRRAESCAWPGAMRWTRATAPASPSAACGRGGRASTTRPTWSSARPWPRRQMERDLDELLETVRQPHLRRLLDRLIGRGVRARRALARGAGRQVLPPGLPPRAVRALPVGRAGRARHGRRPVPGRRPRRRGHRRAAPRHRQARGLRARTTARSSSPTPASSTARSRSATSWCAARSSGSRASRPSSPRRCSTSSSPTTGSSSTAAPSSRARARPPSCT